MLSDRSTGFLAIAGGIIGMVAFGLLTGSLTRLHDWVAIIQFLLLIPVIVGLCYIPLKHPNKIGKGVLYTSVASLVSTILSLLLVFPNLFSEAIYMIPQGIFGACLIIICIRLRKIFPTWLWGWGMIVGAGLILVGIFPLSYAIFVDPIILHIPAPSDEIIQKIPFDTPANNILHLILYIGSFLGVMTFPVWTILLGIKLLQRKIP